MEFVFAEITKNNVCYFHRIEVVYPFIPCLRPVNAHKLKSQKARNSYARSKT